MTVITLFSFLIHVSHEITNEDLQRAAIRARNVPTNWKNMMPQHHAHSTEDWEGLYYICTTFLSAVAITNETWGH